MSTRPDEPPIHSLSDVAHRLGLHPQTVYRQARSGGLPMFKVGGRWFMADDDLSRLIHHQGSYGESP